MDFLSSKLITYCLLTIIVVETTCSCALNQMPGNLTVPAAFVFGDSIVDPGNNNYITTAIKCNFPPYGRDFEGGRPTGRFGNGKIPSDLLAEGFGVKELLPPYLDPTLQLQDLLTGVSFASGGSGYDPLTAKSLSVLSPSDQLEMFKEYIGKIEIGVGKERAATIVSESIYTVCLGTDDIANTYYGGRSDRATHYTIYNYTDLMISFASTFLQELHEMGARKIGVTGLPPIGCVPSQRKASSESPEAERGCNELENKAAVDFNSKLISLINSLNNKLPGVKLVYADIFSSLNDIIQNYKQYGFEVNIRGCCGNGYNKVSFSCNSLTPNTCPDASKYVFWDSFHPTEKACRFLTRPIYQHYVKAFF